MKITGYTLPDARTPYMTVACITNFQTKGIHQKFKIFISTCMSDCSQVTNMVKSDFIQLMTYPELLKRTTIVSNIV